MKKCILLGAFIHLCFFAQGQFGSDAYTPPNIVPQSPEVASLLKYAETPVNYSTGVPNISIPIMSLSGRTSSANVSISYHAGGHRVTEESSWVGLGWSLSTGGQITRTVRGGIDDHAPYGFIHTDATVNAVSNTCTSGTTFQGIDCITYSNNQNGMYDYEPDDFNYSMMGLSGRFMFDQNRTTTNNNKGNIIQFPDQKVIITPTFAPVTVTNGVTDSRERIIAWDITDTNGTVYHFEEGNVFLKSTNFAFTSGGNEPEFGEDPGGSGISYTETWNLTSVTTLSGEQILFEYNTPQVAQGTSGNYWVFNDYNCTVTDEQVGVTISGSGGGYNPNQSVVTYTGVERIYTELSKITIPSIGYIEFSKATTSREDTQFDKYALNRIKLYSTQTTPATLIQDVELIQDYLVSTASSNNEFIGSYNSHGYLENITANQGSFLNKRLRLKEVKYHSVDTSTTSNDSYGYTFEYNATNLPHKRSKGQDHWGYYNNENNNYTLIPDFVANISGYQNATTITFSPSQGSADRDVNTAYSKASVLKSITFPEGGKTLFSFESNSNTTNGVTEYFGGLRIKTIETTANDIIKNKKNYEYEGGHVLSKPIYYSVGVNNVHTMHSSSWQPLLTTQGSYINYTKVTEIESYTKKTGTLANPILIEKERTTVREFSPTTGNINSWNAPYVQEWSSGQLQKLQLGEDNNTKQSTIYARSVYSNPSQNNIKGWSPESKWALTDPSLPFLLTNFNPNGCSTTCAIDTYNIFPGRKMPYSEITTTYEGGQTMVTDKYSYYESMPAHFNPTKVITTESSGITTEVRMLYPQEMADSDLLADNRVNTLLMSEQIKDSVLLKTVKNEYEDFHGLQQKKYVKTARHQLSIVGSSGGFGQVGGPITLDNLEDRLVFHGYYPNGNIQEVSKKDGTHIVYIWGYNDAMPVAKVENATYGQIEALSSFGVGFSIGQGLTTSQESQLRGISGAMVTTYTYKPLVGVTSITDPRGNTIYYDYDGFNRLISVKDKDGNIVSENHYHYKN